MSTLKVIIIFIMFLTVYSCSGTKTEVSWSNKEFKGSVEKIYIIGIAKNDYNRMYFENAFYNKLKSIGISSIPSSTDLPKGKEESSEVIIKKMKENNCDSVLITRVVNQQTKASFSSGSGSVVYIPGPYYGGTRAYERPTLYNSWNIYYSNGYRAVYQPPTTKNVVVLTVESVLYDLQTEDLIWSATMETRVEMNVEDMIEKLVDEAVKDLKETNIF